jgi:hypothetical protein
MNLIGKNMNSSEYELTDEQLRKVLHEPVGPYVLEAYNTELHLVEGLVLAALFYIITIQPHITLPIVCNLIICVGFVITFWYGILTNSQYGSAMRASVFNTIIPILFGVFQVMLALAVAQPVYIFTLLVIPIFLVAIVQFLDHINKHKNPQALKIWKGQYKEIGSQFAEDLFEEFRKFEKETMQKLVYLTIVLGILTLFNYYFPLNLTIKTYISFILIGILLIIGNYFDLNRYFNNSEKLKKYGIKW